MAQAAIDSACSQTTKQHSFSEFIPMEYLLIDIASSFGMNNARTYSCSVSIETCSLKIYLASKP